MGKQLDVEVLRLHKNRHVAIILAILVLLLALLFMALPGTQATYGAKKTGSHIFVLTQDQDVKVSISENNWWIDKGLDVLPGTTLDKNPTVQNNASDCYMRVNMRIIDKETKEGDVTTSKTLDPTNESDKARLEAILNLLYYDTAASTQGTTKNLIEGTPYSNTALAALKSSGQIESIYNHTLFEPEGEGTGIEEGWNSEMKAYSFDYKNGTDNIFKKGSEAQFFSTLLLPSDLSNSELYDLGDFYINVWVQAIQTEGFSSSEEAIATLSNAEVYNSLDNIDGNVHRNSL